MKIAIPSYRRYQEVGNKTLLFLKSMNGFQHDDITIFVANQMEYLRYSVLYPDYNVVIGEKGISNIRNYIMNYYDKDEYVVSLDDDIEGLVSVDETDYSNLFIKGEEELRQRGLTLWGINPVKNSFFMEKQKFMSTNLKFCIGQMFGFINKRLHVSLNAATKEDYEFCLLNYTNYGGVLRFNHFAVKSKMFAAGGIGSKKQRCEQNEIAANHIYQTYPDYCCIVRGGDRYAELRLYHQHRFAHVPESF
tara:strand:+ start:37 stop:780 length:744 start_codon:yes stop_codon:yes gene_type:complete